MDLHVIDVKYESEDVNLEVHICSCFQVFAQRCFMTKAIIIIAAVHSPVQSNPVQSPGFVLYPGCLDKQE